jgi:hypothetical protein
MLMLLAEAVKFDFMNFVTRYIDSDIPQEQCHILYQLQCLPPHNGSRSADTEIPIHFPHWQDLQDHLVGVS